MANAPIPIDRWPSVESCQKKILKLQEEQVVAEDRLWEITGELVKISKSIEDLERVKSTLLQCSDHFRAIRND